MQLGQGGVDIVFGCETKETGEIFNQEADGIMGLGNSEVSVVNQVYPLITPSSCSGDSAYTLQWSQSCELICQQLLRCCLWLVSSARNLAISTVA